MFPKSVRPRRLLGSAIQLVSLSTCVGSYPLAALSAELQAGTKTDAMSLGTSQTVLTGGTKVNSLSAGATQTHLNGAAKVESLSSGANQTLLNGAAKVDNLSSGVKQNPLPGSTKVDALSTGTKQPVLQGGIKDDAALRSSLRLLKPSTDHVQPLAPGLGSTFLPSSVTQYSGSHGSGQGAPFLQTGTPVSTFYNLPLSGVIKPVSSYTLTRTNSRTWVAPGYEVIPSTLSRSAASVPPTSSSFSPVIIKGVTSWMPRFDVTSISQTAALAVTGKDSGTGVAAYAPQYEVHKISVTSQTLPYDPTSVTQKGITSWAPGFEVTVTSRNKGVVVWTPGYELSRLVPGAMKETLSGIWHSGGTTPLIASQGVLPQPQFAKVLVGPSPMVATGLLLPQLRAQALEKISWDEWYKRVARAIYCRWQYTEVGPGVATVRMIVTKDRDISCQLIDFKPAPDINRDAVAETFFRESALKAVRMVTKFEIPELPTPLDSDKVVFDLDLKRVVDGPVGVDVASAHNAANRP